MTSRDLYDIEQHKKEELYNRLLEITKWHAQLQIDFEKELLQELESQ